MLCVSFEPFERFAKRFDRKPLPSAKKLENK